MKKTNYFILAAAAALFAACSSDDGLAPEQQTAQSGQVPVAFDTYVNRTTRAGLTGSITIDQLKNKVDGFGVFAYYTNADAYDQTFTPNFMYNQQVQWGTSGWGYTPLKYWPNEFGSNAFSEDVDKVSFFAYAPYVKVNPASGKVEFQATGGSGPDQNNPAYPGANGDITKGIVGMTRNNAAGDPMVKYISTFYTNEQVDLVWGTIGNSQSWPTKQKNTATSSDNLTEGDPWLNVEHPYATSTAGANKVKFQFLHALASLNIQVDTKANSSTSTAKPDAKSKVYIRSVTFEGFDTKGALNLNNTKPMKALWYNFNCEDELNNGAEVTIKDGRKDGKEGLTPATSEYAAINPTFVQSTVWNDTEASVGVTDVSGNLFCSLTNNVCGIPTNSADPIYVIPNGDPLKVTIEYDVLTADENLAGKLNDGQTKGSVVKNVITRYITKGTETSPAGSVSEPTGTGDNYTGIKLEDGKQYTIKLHLGLNSVEFDAAVTDWNSTLVTGEADLPHNNASSARQR